MKKAIFFVVLAGVFFILVGCGFLGDINVSGTVEDQQDGTPIPNATICLGENKTETDEDGQFQFAGIDGGNYNLKVDREGYNTYSDTVSVRSSEEMNIEIHTLVELLKLPSSNYQLGGYFFPTENITLEDIEFIYFEDPSENKNYFEIRDDYFGNRIYWLFLSPLSYIEEGYWNLVINAGKDDIKNSIEINLDYIPDSAEIISYGLTNETDTHKIEYGLCEKTNRAALHIYYWDDNDRETAYYEDIPVDKNEFSLSLDEILEKDKNYYWRIYSIRSGDVPVRYQVFSESFPLETSE